MRYAPWNLTQDEVRTLDLTQDDIRTLDLTQDEDTHLGFNTR